MGDNLVFIILLALMIGFTLYKKKLTLAGAISGAIISIAIFIGTGFPGVVCLACFFLAATFATSWQSVTKLKLGLSDNEHGKRDILQVLANGGLAGALGLVAFIFPEHQYLILILIASGLSAATADTVSSELGSLYGKKFLNILNFRSDTRGENGVVSLEGFLFGIMGSSLIALTYGFLAEFQWSVLFTIVIAGTAGNLFDSILGATLERTGKINNDIVNFLNTLSAVLLAFLLRSI